MEQSKTKLTDPRIVALLAFFSCALWGSAFSAVKTGYALFGIRTDAWADQLTFGGIRFALAGIMALAFGSIRAKKLLLPNRSSLKKICIISLFQTVLQYFCYYIGLAHTTGVKASVLVGMNVLTGCVIGFLGIILINLDGLTGELRFQLIGDGLILLCTVASGFSSAFMKKLSGGEDPVLLSGWQFLLGGIVLAMIGVCGGGQIGTCTVPAVSVLVYLAFVSAAAYSVWAMLLKHNPVSKVAVYGFMNPVCGVVISAIVLHESGVLRISFLLALLLVCAGIIIVNRTPNR